MTFTAKKKRDVFFVEGPIEPQLVTKAVFSLSAGTDTGAHQIFLGQVRCDVVKGKRVKAIEYTSYSEMAEECFRRVLNKACKKYGLSRALLFHSIGLLKAGEISFAVIASSPHREASFLASRFIVEEVKANAPVFGKEIFEDGSTAMKVNR